MRILKEDEYNIYVEVSEKDINQKFIPFMKDIFEREKQIFIRLSDNQPERLNESDHIVESNKMVCDSLNTTDK